MAEKGKPSSAGKKAKTRKTRHALSAAQDSS